MLHRLHFYSGESAINSVIITQSNYIPWKGYFDSMSLVDHFVLYDTAQFTRRDWRNRNRVKTQHGPKWLSIPVQVKGKFVQAICDTEVVDSHWCRQHWETIHQAYSKAPHFKRYAEEIRGLYLAAESLTFLTDINRLFLEKLASLLDITTSFSMSSDYNLVDGKTERLIEICKQLKANHYYSGPAARNYLDDNLFAQSQIILKYLDFSSYPEYPQLHGSFEHAVTVLDLLFNCGSDATRYLKFSNIAV